MKNKSLLSVMHLKEKLYSFGGKLIKYISQNIKYVR